jgi:hypothetical protein
MVHSSVQCMWIRIGTQPCDTVDFTNMFCFLDTCSSSAVPAAFQWPGILLVTSYQHSEESCWVVQDGSPIPPEKLLFIMNILHCGQNAKVLSVSCILRKQAVH